jgi:pimeloyl-ACP methyl ester carboxylesterase
VASRPARRRGAVVAPFPGTTSAGLVGVLPHPGAASTLASAEPTLTDAAGPVTTEQAPAESAPGADSEHSPSITGDEPLLMIHRLGRRQRSYELAVDIFGAENGTPIFFMHGMPGSRQGPYPRGIVLRRRGVSLIAYDRPGYGNSTRNEGRTIADAAADVEEIADRLNLRKFAVVGRSGGGPYALAVAAKLPDRVTAAAVLVGFAPTSGVNRWNAGMLQDSVDTYDMAEDEQRLITHLTETAEATQENPENFINEWLSPGLSAADRRVVDNCDIRRQLKASYLEALRGGSAYGWADDVMALQRDWEFQLPEVKARTLLWHGEEDRFSPVRHTYWLASQIANHDVVVAPGAGHFGALEALPDVLSWLARRHAEAVAAEV